MLPLSKEGTELISKALVWIRCRKKLCTECIRIKILRIKSAIPRLRIQRLPDFNTKAEQLTLLSDHQKMSHINHTIGIGWVTNISFLFLRSSRFTFWSIGCPVLILKIS